ncbi:ferritin-like domain-containing protein [Ilumatobacter coccineus]|jgi:Ferritin-like domain|uniref:Uncharacterized protein n=1 Tax=Ilumatobacter coccineus (strain NBRC 103263 / KCTC 29153 / YM16-304) TaxID=1313172 RepID=A0A6C7E2A6_ILUCY|nr:ferritin-like domain-containing protein [Ilumatobacter coccineus]BAN02214.1 hypothetical protein YM304_19000 [Ilumatobacter coccineus YM16-304]
MHISTPTTRRDALKFGGLAVSLGALVAACGENVGGSDEAGRVGNAPVVEPLPDLAVDEAVLLRTASSLEYTAVAVFETVLGLDGALPDALRPTVERLIEDHQATAAEMVSLTEAAGGEAWDCPNDWFMERLVAPLVEALGAHDDPALVTADVLAIATALESFAAASHQELASSAESVEARVAHAEAAALEARHAAVLAIAADGPDAYISPALVGEDVAPDVNGQIRQFAVPSTFAQTSQVEIKAGPADANGVRTSYVFQTPADNSFVYNELSCSA